MAPCFVTIVERPCRGGTRPIEVVTAFDRWFRLPWDGSDPEWQGRARAALEAVHHARCFWMAQGPAVREQADLLLTIGVGHDHPGGFAASAVVRPAALAKLADDMFWAVKEAITDKAEGRI